MCLPTSFIVSRAFFYQPPVKTCTTVQKAPRTFNCASPFSTSSRIRWSSLQAALLLGGHFGAGIPFPAREVIATKRFWRAFALFVHAFAPVAWARQLLVVAPKLQPRFALTPPPAEPR
mmetsp:Transcript_16657/g.47431  ORF Transcript_16657/g.47431 Transcript_16657/m.47431 type:complete len:118 (-) Transcript_16657:178-531(-)